jgi:catechol 2,3-dioxygenase-like lactoylglutathione lyase family enzyme
MLCAPDDAEQSTGRERTMKTAMIFFALVLTTAGPRQASSAALPEMYRTVYEVTWVVRDLDQTVAGWRKLGFHGIHVVGNVTFQNVRYRGNRATCVARVAEGLLGDVLVQWIQPAQGDNAYSDFLATHGTGLFSLVHRAPSREALQAEVERMSALGVGVLQTESSQEGSRASIRTYLDTQPQGKYVLGLTYAPDIDRAVPPSPVRKVAQFAFTVRELDPVLDYWSRLGFTDRSVTHPRLWDLRYHDRPADFDADLGWQRHGRVVYEWIRPLKGPTVYIDHMEKHGEGFHHIAFEVDDLDREVARWSALGFPFLQGGAWGEKGKPGWGRYAYQDTDAIAGAEVELLWNYR